MSLFAIWARWGYLWSLPCPVSDLSGSSGLP
jgi:hypothetical protein